MEKKHEDFMKIAVDLAMENIQQGHGGPFGAIVVMGDQVVGRGVNTVTGSNDPTAHAEVNAIRDACRKLGTFQLDGCVIYTSCEPCPMCLGAIYWARPDRVYYAATKSDAAAIGFDDSFIYEEIGKEHQNRRIPFLPLPNEEAMQVFKAWADKEDKIEY